MKIPYLKVAFAFLIAGTILLLYDIKGLVDGYNSMKWPSASGVITKSEIETTLIPFKNRYREHYSPLVEFSYQVDDATYTSSRINLGKELGGPKEFLEGYIISYPIGSDVISYYDPENPALAVLEPGIAPITCMYAGTGGLMLVLTSILFGLSFQKRNKTEESTSQ